MTEEHPPQRFPSLSRRRLSSQTLERLLMPNTDQSELPQPIPVVGDYASDGFGQEIVEEGQALFQNFVVEQVKRESPEVLDEILASTPHGYKNPMWASAGRDLRMLADEFARTKERARVRERADQMVIDIAYEEFHELLSELFAQGGITNERIVVLFYFCSDVAIRSLRAGKDMFRRFFNWSLRFISEHVCSWVSTHGGWNNVLKSPFNSVYKVIIWASAALFVFGVIKFIRRGAIN